MPIRHDDTAAQGAEADQADHKKNNGWNAHRAFLFYSNSFNDTGRVPPENQPLGLRYICGTFRTLAAHNIYSAHGWTDVLGRKNNFMGSDHGPVTIHSRFSAFSRDRPPCAYRRRKL
jgi:hypothetical protein